MLRALVLAALYLLLANTAACTQPLSIFNGSFEDVDEGGSPLNWRSLGADNWDIVPDAARTGALGLRFNACGAHQFLRQQHRGVTGRPFTVCGWFKARGVKMEPETPSGDHARLYVHVLYEGRPYNDGLQAWRDIPPGTYDWRRFVVSVYPNPTWEVSEVWLTVSAQFHEGELLCDDIGVGPAVNWGGASVLDWGNHRQATVITDLSTCQPVSALSNRRQRGKWKVLEYDIPPFS